MRVSKEWGDEARLRGYHVEPVEYVVQVCMRSMVVCLLTHQVIRCAARTRIRDSR